MHNSLRTVSSREPRMIIEMDKLRVEKESSACWEFTRPRVRKTEHVEKINSTQPDTYYTNVILSLNFLIS